MAKLIVVSLLFFMGLGYVGWRKPVAAVTMFFAKEVAKAQQHGGMLSLGQLNRELTGEEKKRH